MKSLALAAAFATLSVIAACDDTEPLLPTNDLSPQIIAVLDTAINDEFHAEYTYLRVLTDFGNVLPFFNVVVAEQRHSASLASLFERRGMAVPASRWSLDKVARFTSMGAACAGAATAELENIAMYDRFLVLQVPADVRTVLSNNRAASLERHYPAFQRCAT